MNNSELYKAAFSNLHADHTLDLEAMKMKDSEKKPMTGLRCKRGLLVTTLVLIMMLAMTAMTYAATDGEIFQAIKVLITSDGSDGQVHEGTYTVDEDGNYNIQLHEGEQVTVEGDGWTSEAVVGDMEGKLTVSEDGTESNITIEKITSEEAISGEAVEGWTPLEDGQELTQDEIKERMGE